MTCVKLGTQMITCWCKVRYQDNDLFKARHSDDNIWCIIVSKLFILQVRHSDVNIWCIGGITLGIHMIQFGACVVRYQNK